jgi:hypothetical protein
VGDGDGDGCNAEGVNLVAVVLADALLCMLRALSPKCTIWFL